MPQSSLEPSSGRDESSDSPDLQGGEAGADVNMGLVLVVGKSPINCVVVAKTVEQAGLRTVAEKPASAMSALYELRPGTVILDGGVDNSDCDEVLAQISRHRHVADSKLPVVIFLTTRNKTMDQLTASGQVDAVVSKPFTPDSLQPVVMRLLRPFGV